METSSRDKIKKFENKKKEKTAGTTQQDLDYDFDDETKIKPIGLKYKDIESTSPSNFHNETQDGKIRIEIFHIRVISKHTKIDTLFDSGSQENLTSKDIAKKLNLETIPHPKPYPLGWICDNAKLHVTKRCKLKFAITANILDEVELDVIPIDIYGIVLGIPYLYDRRVIFHLHENKYHFFKNGIEYVVRVENKKLNTSLVNVVQMKRIVNASQNFALLMIKYVDVNESSLKSDFIDVSNSCDKIF